ncbi:MAG: SH3 domain-containing protein, partial [Gemmatimonadota bacterium]
MEVIAGIYQAGEEVRLEFAPDTRTAIFELGVHREDGELVVYGASSSPAAVEALHARIGALGPGVRVRDAIVRLPNGLAGAPHAIVAAATAPMLAGPVISESHLSQIPLGNRLRVLREQGRWCQCRSADGYLGWVHRGYVERVEESQARAWEAGTSAPVHYCLEGRVLAPDGEVLVRLPWGARIGVTGDTAHLPDGRRGRLEGSTVAVSEMPDRFPLEGEAIAETASLWCGAPYLWGGTTVWGVD